MNIWQNLMKWLSEGGFRPITWSAVALLLAAAAYLFTRRRIYALRSERPVVKQRLRLLALTVTFLLLVALVRIWTNWALEPTASSSGQVRTFLENAIWTCAAAAAVYIVTRAAQRTLIKGSVDIEARHKLRLSITWAGVLAFVIAAIFIWGGQVRNLGIFLGILGAGVALSLQETLVSIAGWLLLVIRKPFDIGDRIEIDGRVGDVIGVSVFQTSMLEVGNWIKADQSTGRMLIIPNSMLFRHAVYNYSKGFPFIWDELSTTVTFESDWEEAERLMLEKAEIEADKMEAEVKRQIEKMQARYAIHYEKFSPIVYTSIDNNGVTLSLRYLSPVRQRRTMNHRISRNVLKALLAHPRIDLAYPTTRIYRNNEEGKPALGGPGEGGSPRPGGMY